MNLEERILAYLDLLESLKMRDPKREESKGYNKGIESAISAAKKFLLKEETNEVEEN